MRESTQDPAWYMLVLVPISFLLLIYPSLFAVGSDDFDPFGGTDLSKSITSPYKVKTLLNRGGLGWPYGEGAHCLVDLWADFTPLGTFEGQPVARYTRRVAWWSFKQCPTGSLVHMDMATLAAWQDARRAEHAATQRKAQALQALTNAAKAR